MAAHIVERPDIPVRAAHQQDGPAGHGDGHRIARPGQFVRETREHPGAGENPLVLQREKRLAHIGRSGQSAGDRSRRLELAERTGPDNALQGRPHADIPDARQHRTLTIARVGERKFPAAERILVDFRRTGAADPDAGKSRQAEVGRAFMRSNQAVTFPFSGAMCWPTVLPKASKQ